MMRRIFGSPRCFNVEQPEYRRKTGIQILPANDDDKGFKRSIKNISKTIEDVRKIRAAVDRNEFISHIITDKRFEAICRTIYSQEVLAGEIIILEGEIGSQLYVSALGKYEVTTRSGVYNKFEDVRVFGELALLYNAKRKATVRAITKGKLWVLENQTFKEIVKRSEDEERNELVNFLTKVPTLNTVSTDNLRFVADLLSTKFYPTGSQIVREGESGDAFYIVRAGSVRVKTKKEGQVAQLTRGQYFGELSLIKEDVRNATVEAESPGCECLILSRMDFIKHFGEVRDFQTITGEHQLKEFPVNDMEYFKELKLENLKKIRTVGAGGFGRVDIVQHKNDEKIILALKYLKKDRCALQEQKDHVFNEKNVQMNCSSPFIIRLYKTFKDSKYLYFLMEAQLGGDLWRLMYYKRRKAFIETEAKFYVGCVIEAFQYLHERGIIYRDLKPENLLIVDTGYVKLTDFGFAKIIGNVKTHSMVGTPDYMPPEIVFNKSHDRAVDCWTLGIFIFELISLKTPFKTISHHDTYNMILKGIEFCKFPQHVSSKCKHLIMKLCKKRPNDRLGYSKNGMMDVKKHPWFSNFDWNLLEDLQMNAPYIPKLTGSLDLSNFSLHRDDHTVVAAVTSNWDEDF